MKLKTQAFVFFFSFLFFLSLNAESRDFYWQFGYGGILPNEWKYLDEAGMNSTTIIHLADRWKHIEQKPGIYSFESPPSTMIDMIHNALPNVKAYFIESGPLFRDGYLSSIAPPWVDVNNFDLWTASLLKYLEAVAEYSKGFPLVFFSLSCCSDLTRLYQEFEKPNTKKTAEKYATVVKKMCTTIRKVNKNAKIILGVTHAAFAPGNLEFQTIDLLKRAGCTFDCIGVEIHPGFHSPESIAYVEKYYDEVYRRFKKPIYIWETFFIASPADSIPYDFQPKEGYSPEWQAKKTIEFLRYANSNPHIIGVAWVQYIDIVWEGTELLATGFMDEQRNIRPVHDAVKSFWNDLK
jgi:hypothetical protein